jgi:hypothetical protein
MVRPGGPELQQCLCVAPCCTHADPRPLETLQHMFFECAVGQGALKWLAGLWGLLDPGGTPVPLVASVWLADAQAVWQPPSGLASLWTLLRLTLLKCIWAVRCATCKGQGLGYTRSAVVGAFVREVKALIWQDWARVVGDVRTMAGVPPSWFRGRDPTTTRAQFEKAWCAGGVLASVQQQQQGGLSLVVGLTVDTAPRQWIVALPEGDVPE